MDITNKKMLLSKSQVLRRWITMNAILDQAEDVNKYYNDLMDKYIEHEKAKFVKHGEFMDEMKGLANNFN